MATRHPLAGLKRYLNWRAALVYLHRWLGIAGCLLFVAWFASGVVLMYARMPEMAPEEQLARSAPLDLEKVRLTPAQAFAAVGADGAPIELAMLGDRPVYQVGGRAATVIYADTGDFFEGFDAPAAEAQARRFEPGYTGTMHRVFMEGSDQWTLQARGLLPMHRFSLDDAARTDVYVSDVSGEVVLRTTRRDRFWGYLGPVTHWLYFTPLRSKGKPWFDTVVWSSAIGCVMCISGLLWGLLRFSLFARFRLKRQSARSPYAGWMKWHHYAGLIFGAVTLTWTYSGLLSMEPFGWFEPIGRRGGRPPAVAAEPESAAAISLDQMKSAYVALSSVFPVKRMRLTDVADRLYWTADRAPDETEADQWRSPGLLPREATPRLARRYVAALAPAEPVFERFPRPLMESLGREQVDAPVEDAAWLDAYDGYYYDSAGTLPLPVLRVRYQDDARTWVYVDPSRGGVVRRNESITRMRRWLYQGLHSLDFPFLYYHRPLWDIVAIVLSIGGLALSITTIMPALRRLRRRVAWLGRLIAWPLRRRSSGTVRDLERPTGLPTTD
jgi:hypothetical protein